MKDRVLLYRLGDTTAPGPRAPRSVPAAAATSMDELPCAEARRLSGALTQETRGYSWEEFTQNPMQNTGNKPEGFLLRLGPRSLPR